MNEIMTISGVSCYEKDGTAYLNLEAVARGLGFTKTDVTLLNEYPGLGGREILYRVLDVDSGISMEPESGALVYAEQKFRDAVQRIIERKQQAPDTPAS